MGIAHWDDVEWARSEFGHLRAESQNLGGAAGSIGVGVRRIRMEPGDVPTPQHVHPVEEEIFFVLEGSGLSRQDDKTYEVRVGDCLVHRAMAEAHTLRAGDDGVTVLAYGHRMRTPGAYLPNANRYWLNPSWTEAGHVSHPFDAEPELDWPEPSPRPPNILSVDDAEANYDGERGRWVRLAYQAGAVRSGLNWGRLEPGRAGARPHCHSAEEEIFIVLEGGGTLDLWPSPARAHDLPREQHEVRVGHVIARPPGTGVSHSFMAGDEGMTMLLYGTREPNDICYYPRSNKVYLRGVGLVARVEPLDYDDGEPEE